MEKTEIIIKQEKIINILNKLEDWKLDLLSEDNPNMDKLAEADYQILMDCVWIDLGKEDGTEKEINNAIKNIIVLCTLESFRRKGLTFINKKGNYDKTPLGRAVYKRLIKEGINSEEEKEITCEEISSPNLKFKIFSDGNMILETKNKEGITWIDDIFIDKEDISTLEEAIKKAKLQGKEE